LTPDDLDHYRRLGLPGNLATDPTASNDAGLADRIGKPTNVDDPERKERPISLAECISLALENSGSTNGQGGGTGRTSDGLVQFAGNGLAGQPDAIRVLALDPAITGANIEASLAKFDAQLVATAQWQHTDQPL